LQNEAKDRPSANEAMLHRWFDSQTPERPQMKLGEMSSMNLGDFTDELKHREKSGLQSIFEDLASMVEHNALQQLLLKGYIGKLGDSDVDEYKKQFDKLDSDKDGFLTGPDLVRSFTTTGIGANEASSLASIVMDRMDCNESKKIPFKKFLESKLKYTLSTHSLHAFKDILTASNANLPRSQIVPINELSNLRISAPKADQAITFEDIMSFQKLQKHTPIPTHELKEIFVEFDKDGDGKLSYDDFVSAVKTKRVVSDDAMQSLETIVATD